MGASIRFRAAARAVLLAAVAALLTAASAAAQRTVDRRYAADPDAQVRIHVLAGSVRVQGWDADSVVVTGTVQEPANGEWVIGGTREGIKMSVWSNDPGPEAPPSHLEVRVPRGAQVWVKTASAAITVADVTGGVDATSTTGAVTVAGSPREVVAESMGGDVSVEAETRVLRARTASGALRIRGRIRDVTATTVSGALTVEGGGFERATLESIDGDITYRADFERGSALEFINHSGATLLELPAGAAADFTIGTFYGSFEDRWGVRARYGGNKLKGQQISFTLGDGGSEVVVRSFKGRVVLSRAQ